MRLNPSTTMMVDIIAGEEGEVVATGINMISMVCVKQSKSNSNVITDDC